MVRKILVVLGVVTILAVSLLAMQGLSGMKEEVKNEPQPEARRYVKTSKVAYESIPTELVAFGRVNSSLPLDLITEVSGKILQGNVPLKEGQRFRKGTLLFKVDNTEAKLRLQASKSNFLKDIASILPDLKIDYPESYDAWQNYFDAIDVEKPLPELPKHKNNKEKTYLATKNIFNSYYTIKSTEVNLTKYNVYAPFGGTIAEVQLQVGSYANPGAKVAKISKSSSLELKVAVEPNDIRWVTLGSTVAVSTEDDTQSWRGKVIRIGDILNANTQALDVFIRLTPGEQKLYEGMYLKATMSGSKVGRAMEIPRNALVGTDRVYILQDSLLKFKDIKVHKLNNETAIISGLNEGTSLIMEPVVGAYEDMKIFRIEDQAKHEKMRKEKEEMEAKDKKEDEAAAELVRN